MLLLVEGPAGSGKSQLVADMLASGEIAAQADLTAIWAALRGIERDPETGRYPIRDDSDPIIAAGLAAYVRAVVVRQGLADGLDVAVTTGTPNMATHWQEVAAAQGATFRVQTVDPGEATVRARLATEDGLSTECVQAIRRWYG